VFILYSQLLGAFKKTLEQIVVKISNSYGTGTLTNNCFIRITSAHVNFLLQQLGKITFSQITPKPPPPLLCNESSFVPAS
jgi:hypothetical protein